MLNLMDFYGTSFIVFFLTIGEIIAVSWVYGEVCLQPNHFQIETKTIFSTKKKIQE